MNKNPCNSKGCTDFFVCYNFWRWRFCGQWKLIPTKFLRLDKGNEFRADVRKKCAFFNHN